MVSVMSRQFFSKFINFFFELSYNHTSERASERERESNSLISQKYKTDFEFKGAQRAEKEEKNCGNH
jgi:hypothetical protein